MISAFDRHLPLAILVIAGGVTFTIAVPCNAGKSLAAAMPADPSGTWLVEDGDARIRIVRCPRTPVEICGYLVWAKPSATGEVDRDEHNPDVLKRSRPLLGTQILLGLEADGAAWSGGVYNAENGKTYDAHVTRIDAAHLALKGCVLRYLCQSQVWTKVDDVAPGELVGRVDQPGGPRSEAAWMAEKTSGRRNKR